MNISRGIIIERQKTGLQRSLEMIQARRPVTTFNHKKLLTEENIIRSSTLWLSESEGPWMLRFPKRHAHAKHLKVASYEFICHSLQSSFQIYREISQCSRSVVSDSLWPHGLQHSSLPCPSPTPKHVQTQVHWVNDAIQPSHPLSSPSSPAFNLSQHQGLFQQVSSLYKVAKVLELQFEHLNEYSGLISFRIDCVDLLAV